MTQAPPAPEGPTEHPAPVTDRRGLSQLAYGFMASKALFAALGIDLFTHLAAGPRTPDELCATTGVPVERLGASARRSTTTSRRTRPPAPPRCPARPGCCSTS